MGIDATAMGRRERNKQDKMQRIVAAASELFAERGIDDVTTQEIAEHADIGAGTLFLYVKTKGELLLLVQNSAYAVALERGIADASTIDGTLDAMMAIVRPIVECNRTQIDNGRTYLREIVFGDAHEPHHRAALEHTLATEAAIAVVLERDGLDPDRATATAHILSAVMFLTLAASINAEMSIEELLDEISCQARLLLPR